MVLALLLLLLHPFGDCATASTAIAQTTSAPQVYRVEFRPRLQAFGYTGQLTLYVSSDGYVNGTYRPDTGGRLEHVRGGHQGNRMWFDVPTLGGLHVEATVNDTGMSGVASSSGISAKDYIFTAKPEASPAP